MAIDRTIQVLRARARMELDEAAKAFADVVDRHAERDASARRIDAAQQATRDEVRRLAGVGSINVATYDLVRRMHRTGHAQALEARMRLTEVESELDQARGELGRLRLLDAGLSRVLERSRAERNAEREAHAQAATDDLWLQSLGRPR